MSRLTRKSNQYDDTDYSYVRKHEDIELIEIMDKLGKLEDLEEKIGCPLDIRCRVVTDSVIYDENGVEYKVVYTYMDYFDCENPFDNEMGYCDLCAFSWVDYKETWWLREDKSE